jgi:hypothetical protein
MASGLQCPGCGHVHPSGLPEIARGDATFRCYGCYRTLSVPEGWTGRPAPRAAPPPSAPMGGGPRGAGTRDARSARLAGRRSIRPGSEDGGESTQMVPMVGPDAGVTTSPAPNWPAADAAGGWAGAAGTAVSGSAGVAGARTAGGAAAAPNGVGRADAGGPGVAPLGWVAPRRSGRPLPLPTRAVVWAGAFGFSLLISAFVLKKVGLLDVNTVLDVFAGSGPRRFGILLAMLPLWALLTATIAHFSLEALTRRRRPRPVSQRPPADTSPPF